METGKCYFVDDGARFWVGRCVEYNYPLVKLEDCALIGDTGRFHVFMRTGQSPQMEVEPCGTFVITCRNWREWDHPLFPEAV